MELQGMNVGGAMADKRGAGSVAPIQSVDRALQILEYLSEVPELGTSDIARKLGVHRSTVSRLLATLEARDVVEQVTDRGDRKSTRLNSSHVAISYAVFCFQ